MDEAKQGLLSIAINFIKDNFNKVAGGDMTPLISLLFGLAVLSIGESLIHAWWKARKGEELQWKEYPLKYGLFGGVLLFLAAIGLTLIMALITRLTPEVLLGP